MPSHALSCARRVHHHGASSHPHGACGRADVGAAQVLSALVSSKTGEGLDGLMSQIALQADLLDLKANPDRLATGTVLEARQVQGQGAVATVLVQRGTLRVGDIVVAGAQWGRVKSLVNERTERLTEAPPSMVPAACIEPDERPRALSSTGPEERRRAPTGPYEPRPAQPSAPAEARPRRDGARRP